MLLGIDEEAGRLRDATVSPAAFSPPSPSSGDAPPVLDVLLTCPSCGSFHVAQMLGDNGGISFVCTACGHSWS
ncbi:hypothetical protein [Streptomyces sp. NPDC006552]|uniref:hypothetical protein n=1 Tax=Streptomyces sp. NPDC006552 TaxID=3157179 RepID=UPI00339DC020